MYIHQSTTIIQLRVLTEKCC